MGSQRVGHDWDWTTTTNDGFNPSFFVFFFVGISILFSIVAVSICISSNSVRWFPFLHSVSSILFVDILILTILISVKWPLIVVLICFSLIMSDVEHLFISLLATYMSSLEKCLFRSFSHFLIGLFFWYWVVWAACIFWKLILSQLFHLLLFSPIQRVVFSPCL